MVSTSTHRNHALYIDVLVANSPEVVHTSHPASKNTQDLVLERLDIVTGRFKGEKKHSKKLLSRCREKMSVS